MHGSVDRSWQKCSLWKSSYWHLESATTFHKWVGLAIEATTGRMNSLHQLIGTDLTRESRKKQLPVNPARDKLGEREQKFKPFASRLHLRTQIASFATLSTCNLEEGAHLQSDHLCRINLRLNSCTGQRASMIVHHMIKSAQNYHFLEKLGDLPLDSTTLKSIMLHSFHLSLWDKAFLPLRVNCH